MSDRRDSPPLIGITARHGQTSEHLPAVLLLRPYVTAIVEAGGVPILIPPDLPEEGWRTLLERLDGILFSGGADIAIERYGGQPHPAVYLDPIRDDLELPLMQAALAADKAVLGICRGCQVMNVALGGTLYTHIADQLPGALQHDQHNGDSPLPFEALTHIVQIESDSQLAHILGTCSVQVNSLHHQGIKDLAPGLRATAFAPDGLIEGIELPGHRFALAIQWHPEWLTEHAPMRRLFQAFVQAARASRAS